jgi:hypothetical protein
MTDAASVNTDFTMERPISMCHTDPRPRHAWIIPGYLSASRPRILTLG